MSRVYLSNPSVRRAYPSWRWRSLSPSTRRGAMVSLCRSAVLNSRINPARKRYPLFFPSCPSAFVRFTDLPLRRTRRLKLAAGMDAPPEGYRRNVGICLVNSSNKIFSASRLDVPGAWQMPQGGVDDGEDLRIAAARELREETGVTSAEIITETPYWLTYDFPPAVREKLNKQWGTDWKGQAQKWFLFSFTGKEEEINLSGDGSEKPEFGEWSWMTPQQVIDLAVDFKKPVYEEVMRIFDPHLQSDSTTKV